MLDVVQTSLFDYSALDADTREFVQEITEKTHILVRQTDDNIVQIGRNLQDVKDKLPHGQYLPWLEAEFGWTDRTAQNFMNYARLITKNERLSFLPREVGYVLGQKSMPDVVIEKALNKEIPATVEAVREEKRKALEEEGFYYIPDQRRVFDAIDAGIIEVEEDVDEDTEDAPEYPTERVPLAEVFHPLAPSKPFPEIYAPDPVVDVKEKRDAHVMRVMGSSESPEWYTPQEIVQLSIELLGEIDLDPCSNSRENPNVPARTLYTKEDDGLSQPWEGKVYLNPPYGSEIPQWIEKLVQSYKHGVTEAIALLPARIDTQWFQPLYEFPMCNVRGRLQFENASNSAPFPSVIVYLGKRIEEFIKVFKDRGPIMRRIG